MLIQLVIPSWNTGFSQPGYSYDELSFQIGIIALGVYAWTIINLRKIQETGKVLVWLMLGISILYIFLMLSISEFVWKTFSFLQYIQYPWRLLSFVPISVAYLAAYKIDSLKLHRTQISVIIIFFATIFSYQYMRPVTYEPRVDAYYFTKKDFTDGTSSMGNSFSTIWTSWKKDRPKDVAQIISGDATIVTHKVTPIKYYFEINARVPSIVRFNIVYYPGWTVMIGQSKAPIDFIKDGVVQFQVGSGITFGSVYFGETPLRVVSDIVSVGSIIILCVIIMRRRVSNL